MKEKYCVLPGQKSVRLATTEGGHACIVGETPREIPAIFEQEALGKGCISETMLKSLEKRIKDGPGDDDPNAKDKGGGAGADADERLAKIKAATIEIVNSGHAADLTNGKPKLDMLSAKVGFEVSGAERDAAFNSL